MVHPPVDPQPGAGHHDDDGLHRGGAILLPAAAGRPVPGHHLPGGGGADRIPGRRARIGGVGRHAQGRGDRQHHLRHRRDLFALLPGHLRRRHQVRPERRCRPGRAGRARQDRADPAAVPRRGQGTARAAL
ncbi:hypothetical protein CBM2625_A190093 [Cupriavidus taiwanensis]|nr:hypothetical protein CBM2625_A190093 [Cupriavidus taiwanensis]